jgi:hypothetical protein
MRVALGLVLRVVELAEKPLDTQQQHAILFGDVDRAMLRLLNICGGGVGGGRGEGKFLRSAH